MATGRILVLCAITVLVIGDFKHDRPSKTPMTVSRGTSTIKDPKYRSANPEAKRGTSQKLSMMNRTDDHGHPRRKQDNLSKIHQLNREHQQKVGDVILPTEGFKYSNKEFVDNKTAVSFTDKMRELRGERPTYLYVDDVMTTPHAAGVFCNFETEVNSTEDLCFWTWNQTLSGRGLGFKVVTAEDLVKMNSSMRGVHFSGPTTDADYNENGHFLYLPVDPTMDSMVIKSPPFSGLLEFCKFEAIMHQSGMQNATIKLLSESTVSDMQWVLLEMAGNNLEEWHTMRFTIGKVHQEVNVILEITRPSFVSLSRPLPHFAIDNIRMLECLPEPPVFNGKCPINQLKCVILNRESCVKLQQVCDLVEDCDNGSDEQMNCDKMPYGSYCNFELDDCGFVDIPQPILKWSRHHGPTPTAKTGPNYDHTCGPPPDPTTTSTPELDVPLSPAHMNQPTDKQCIGYYFFVNMNVTGPNKERADFASTAVMRTQVFNPPPKVHGNASSSYYNCCMIRFYYQQNGKNYGSLSVDLVELTRRGNISTPLWFSTKDKGEKWYRASIILPYVTNRYYIEFKTRMGMRIYSDSAIDDFSMSPECFGLNIPKSELSDYNYYSPVLKEELKTTPHEAFINATYYRFGTCNAAGPYGPTQEMCDQYYNNTLNVTVTMKGIQVWDVPAEGLYTIIAIGASGGYGSAWTGVSHGARTRALFELHKGEKIYMLIGQKGVDACKKTLSAQEAKSCDKTETRNATARPYTSKTHEVRNTEINDGGGGGGGGTFVFVVDENGTKKVLMAAGGGGGISVGAFRDDGSQHGKLWSNTTFAGLMLGESGESTGATGGRASSEVTVKPGVKSGSGAALFEGADGGLACKGPAHGGFGGGGGGCLKGGGGGGWIGGLNETEGTHGGGGWSFINQSMAVEGFSDVRISLNNGPGEVVIVPAIHGCNCDYRCVAIDEVRSEIRCYCPSTWLSDSHDTSRCVLPTASTPESWTNDTFFILLLVAIIICAGAAVCICLYLYNVYQRKKEAELRSKQILDQEVQLHRLRNAPRTNDNGTMAFNPHYGTETVVIQGMDGQTLPKVCRESLKLVKALGQGAFGEVYQGLYKHGGESFEMPVAVKTLPEMSTGQAESDFLMEAAIMAKFNHPNIVHLIGVCFDRHPRFIVLELLGGGDLKCFLRESRPRPDRPSSITMKDLLLCSLDVCKGCRYLESKRFIHRDIAARNCLLTARGPGRVAKIADFGMARDIYRSDYYKKDGKAMLPIKWMPPESYVDGIFTGKTDVWSFGVLLWEVFSLGVMPYTGCSNREVMLLVSGGGRLEKPFSCPQDVYQLMCECWNPSPEGRPTFAEMCDRIQVFLQDPEIVDAPLPMMTRDGMPPAEPQFDKVADDGTQRPPSDYLVPTPQDCVPSPTHLSPPEAEMHHSKSPPGSLMSSFSSPPPEVSPSLAPSKALLEYGNIPIWRQRVRPMDYSAVSGPERHIQFLPSKSTDRLLFGVVEGESDADSVEAGQPAYLETSFCASSDDDNSQINDMKSPIRKTTNSIPVTPTTPQPPKNALSTEKLSKTIIDKTNHKPIFATDKKIYAVDKPPPIVLDKTNYKPVFMFDKKMAPIASPDSPRVSISPRIPDASAIPITPPPPLPPKPKLMCLDAAQLEQNLNALKRNSGSVNLHTMNITPPYINVVTPNKLAKSDAKKITIDPKKTVLYERRSLKDVNVVPPNEGKTKLKQSHSANSLLNGPMTDVPYVDSDNTSSSSGSNAQRVARQNSKNNQKESAAAAAAAADQATLVKQGSNDAEISC